MRTILTAVLVLFISPLATAQEQPLRYSEVDIVVAGDRVGLADVWEIGEIDHGHIEETPTGFRVRAVLSEPHQRALQEAGYELDILVYDVVAELSARSSSCPSPPDYAPAGFFYGSLFCYPTLQETVTALDAMRTAHPNLVAEKVSIGQSWEGRDIWVVRITAADDPEAVPEVLYTSLHHAREPQSLASVLWFMYYVLEHYGTDPEVTALLDNRALYFIPVLNPDGYRFVETDNFMWRKNRRPSGMSFGVDLNRNYAYEWGGFGSSSVPSSDIYRGPEPFSEPETQALRQWLQTRQIGAAYNYHSYSDVWLHPFGYDFNTFTPDHDLYTALSAEITRYNNYEYGTGADVLYRAAGISDDWMYGDQTEIGKIFAFTPEIGNSSDNFWPQSHRIAPLSQGTLHPNLVLAWFVGAYPREIVSQQVGEAFAGNGHLDPGEEGVALLSIENFGIGDLVGSRGRIVSLNPDVEIVSSPWSEPFDFPAQQLTTLPPISFVLGSSAALGIQEGLAVEIEMEEGTAILPLDPIEIGTPVLVLDDSFDSFENWTLNQWGVTVNAYSPPFAVTDSPGGNYSNNVINTLRLRDPLDLTTAVDPTLRFVARWDIQADYDFLQVRASTNNASWTALQGLHTRYGSGLGVQPAGEPGYDGQQPDWVYEEVDLSAFVGEPAVYLQFRMRSDESITASGFVLDDVRVMIGYEDGGSVSTDPGARPSAFALEPPYPNPVRDRTHLRFVLDGPADVRLTIYDLLGRPVATILDGPRDGGSHAATWDARTDSGLPLSAGVYLATLTADGRQRTQRLVLVP